MHILIQSHPNSHHLRTPVQWRFLAQNTSIEVRVHTYLIYIKLIFFVCSVAYRSNVLVTSLFYIRKGRYPFCWENVECTLCNFFFFCFSRHQAAHGIFFVLLLSTTFSFAIKFHCFVCEPLFAPLESCLLLLIDFYSHTFFTSLSIYI